MDHNKMRTASKLLAKAESTNFEAEAIALVEKSYRLLAGVISSANTKPGSKEVRQPAVDRRRIPDRRIQPSHATPSAHGSEAEDAITYNQLAKGLRQQATHHVDHMA